MTKEKNKTLYLSHFTDQGKLFFLKKPIKITVQKKENIFLLFNKKINVYAYDEDCKKAYEIFEEIFATQYRLTQEKNQDLTKRARLLKQYLLSIVEKAL